MFDERVLAEFHSNLNKIVQSNDSTKTAANNSLKDTEHNSGKQSFSFSDYSNLQGSVSNERNISMHSYDIDQSVDICYNVDNNNNYNSNSNSSSNSDDSMSDVNDEYEENSTSISSSDSANDSYRITDNQMKSNIMNYPFIWFQDALKCSKSYSNGMKCFKNSLDLFEVLNLRLSFWGKPSLPAPTRSERIRTIKTILNNSYDNSSRVFKFSFANKPICEKGFLILLGLIKSTEDKVPNSWSKQKTYIQNPYVEEIDKSFGTASSFDKSNACDSFIYYIGEFYSDTCPTDGNIKILPYENVTSLYQEYSAHTSLRDINSSVASITTFRNCFRQVRNKYRLITAKGAFQTCDICNNANAFLRFQNNANRYQDIKEQREVILSYKRLHLEQQAAERQYQLSNREKCFVRNENGQPLQAYILIDGMTASRGETPKVGAMRTSKEDYGKLLGNRIIGVEIVCGFVDDIFLYHTDDLISGGSNTLIEVLRQTLIDLQKMLKLNDKSITLPRVLYLQFDNCGENKNKNNEQSLGQDTREDYSLKVNKTILEDIVDMFKKKPDDSKGYLVVLSNDDDPIKISKCFNPKLVLPKELILDTNSMLYEKDHDLNGNLNGYDKSVVKDLLSKAKRLTVAANHVENCLQNGRFTKTMNTVFCYESYVLTQEEVEFWKVRSSNKSIFLMLRNEILNEPHTFETIPLIELSEAEKIAVEARTAAELQKTEAYRASMSTLLQKSNHNFSDGTQMVGGITHPNYLGIHSQTRQLPVNKTCAVIECQSVGNHSCAESSCSTRIFCDIHGPLHTQHANQTFKILLTKPSKSKQVTICSVMTCIKYGNSSCRNNTCKQLNRIFCELHGGIHANHSKLKLSDALNSIDSARTGSITDISTNIQLNNIIPTAAAVVDPINNHEQLDQNITLQFSSNDLDQVINSSLHTNVPVISNNSASNELSAISISDNVSLSFNNNNLSFLSQDRSTDLTTSAGELTCRQNANDLINKISTQYKLPINTLKNFLNEKRNEANFNDNVCKVSSKMVSHKKLKSSTSSDSNTLLANEDVISNEENDRAHKEKDISSNVRNQDEFNNYQLVLNDEIQYDWSNSESTAVKTFHNALQSEEITCSNTEVISSGIIANQGNEFTEITKSRLLMKLIAKTEAIVYRYNNNSLLLSLKETLISELNYSEYKAELINLVEFFRVNISDQFKTPGIKNQKQWRCNIITALAKKLGNVDN